MSTRKNYRQIYEQHYGSIPVDNCGRTYEIHHCDGDCTNNSIDNLSCIYCRAESSLHAFKRRHGDNCDCNPESLRYKEKSHA